MEDIALMLNKSEEALQARYAKAGVRGLSESAKLAALKDFHRGFLEYQNTLNDAVMSQLTAEEKEAMKAEDELRLLRAELESAQVALTAPESLSFDNSAISSFSRFVQVKGDASARIAAARCAVESVVVDGVPAAKPPSVDVEFCSTTAWEKERAAIERMIEEMQQLAKRGNDHSVLMSGDVCAIERDFEDICQKMATTQTALQQHEQTSRTRGETQARELAEFDSECTRPLSWCRQQLIILSALAEPDQIQEYCASLLGNFSVMDENFEVLGETISSYLPNPSAESKLAELNGVWIQLQMRAFERLRFILFEIHPKSYLENEVRKLSGYAERISAFLLDFQRQAAFLSRVSDKAKWEALSGRADEIAATVQHHADVTRLLEDFADRTEMGRAGYNCFRRSPLARLTFLEAPGPTMDAAKRRKEDFSGRLQDLQQWANERHKEGTVQDVQRKIAEIRAVIVQEQRALEGK